MGYTTYQQGTHTGTEDYWTAQFTEYRVIRGEHQSSTLYMLFLKQTNAFGRVNRLLEDIGITFIIL